MFPFTQPILLDPLLSSYFPTTCHHATCHTMSLSRNKVKDMFDHGYSGYMRHAFPHDELQPLTCQGMETWGSYSLTLIDALDTLVVCRLWKYGQMHWLLSF